MNYTTAADEYNDLILGRIDVVAIESVNAGYTTKADLALRVEVGSD